MKWKWKCGYCIDKRDLLVAEKNGGPTNDEYKDGESWEVARKTNSLFWTGYAMPCLKNYHT